MSSVSIMTECGCGASFAEPNFECERCRLVYFVLETAAMRELQRTYFATRDEEVLKQSKAIESRIDKMITRLTADPIQRQERE